MRWTEFRRRGGAWVVAQSVLMATIAVAAFVPPRIPGVAPRIAGVVLAAAGVALVVWAFRSLGPAMTPFPEPRRHAELRERGAYGLVRHPMYGGGVLVFAGIALATTLPALVATAALAVLWDLKARREEAYLLERHPRYAEYRARVGRRFWPYVL